MGLRNDWTRRAAVRQTPRQPRQRGLDGRYTRNRYPPPQPIRGTPIVTADALMTVPWIWFAVHTSAEVAAGFPLRSDVADGEALDELMRWDPIGQTGYTAKHLLRDTYIELQVHGLGFWQPVDWDDMDRPSAVMPLSSEDAYARRDRDGVLRVDVWGGHHGRRRSYGPDEVVWFQRGGALGGTGAYSPVRFKARQAGEDILQSEHAHQALVAGGVTQGGIYYTTPKDIGPDVAQEWAEFIDLAGGGRSGRTLVLGDQLEGRPLGMNWAELQLLEARRYSAVETLATWGMPPGLAGVSIDGASTTYSNLNQDLSLWSRMTLEPLSSCVTETMSVWWEPMHAHTADLTRLNPLERAKQHEIEVRTGTITRNEVREAEGRDPLPELDQLAAAAAAPAPPAAVGTNGPVPQRVMLEEIVEEMARNGRG